MEINLLDSFEALFSSSKRIYWQYLLSSLIIALMYLLIYKKERKINLSTKLWLHTSAILDYKYFIVSFFIKTLLIVPIVIGVNEITLFVYEYLTDYFGYKNIKGFSYSQIVLLYTLTLFVVSDFTRYWLHRFLHTIPFLWEFHKVHHSAKVLNPLTFYRVHPVENILFGFRYSLSIGLVSGVFVYFFGAMISTYEILGANVFLYVFSLMGSNLRHSHIKICYPKMVENILISPFQHQLHHSTKYYNKNFGGYLSIWDKIFGTLQISKEILNSKETIRFGVEIQNFKTITDLLYLPFKKSVQSIKNEEKR